MSTAETKAPYRRRRPQLPEGGPGAPAAQAGDRAGAPRPRRHPALPRRGARAQGHARHRLRREGAPSVPRSHFNELAREGKVRNWREAFASGTVKASGPAGDPQADPERRGEAGGAQPHAQAEDEVTPRMPRNGRRTSARSCAGRRATDVAERFAQAQADHAAVANAIAAFEPVLMAADPRLPPRPAGSAVAGVDVVEIRSTTPGRATPARSSSLDGDERAGVHFGFNGWGEKFAPVRRRARFATRVLAALGARARDAHPPDPRGRLDHRRRRGHADHDRAVPVRGAPQPAAGARGDRGGAARPARRRARRLARPRSVEDHDTDGHVDNICAFVAPGKVVLQTVTDEADRNHEHCRENLAGSRPPASRSSSFRGCPRPGRRPGGRRAVHSTTTSATVG